VVIREVHRKLLVEMVMPRGGMINDSLVVNISLSGGLNPRALMLGGHHALWESCHSLLADVSLFEAALGLELLIHVASTRWGLPSATLA
jgi:hypothetical protein